MKKNRNKFLENNDAFSILPNLIYDVMITPYTLCRTVVEIALDTDKLREKRDYSFE